MPTYTAEFHTDAEWALLDIKAATPEKALAKARAVDPLTLDFQPYDDLQPVNYITIRDKDCNDLVEWQDDDLRLQKAAPELLEALEYFFNIMHDYESSRKKGYVRHAMGMARAALAAATRRKP